MIPVDYREGQGLSERCVCAECHGLLSLAWGGKYGVEGYVLLCTQSQEHTGLVEKESLTQAHRRGAALPVAMAQEIDKRGWARRGALAVREPYRLAPILTARFPQLEKVNQGAVTLFAVQCLGMGLDPLLGEVYPLPFRNSKTDQYVVVPLISEQGYGSLAARACPEAWNGPPTAERVTDPGLKEDLCGDPEAWMWSATGRRKDWEPGREFTTYGWVTHKQQEKAKADGTPAGELPGNQARVRAVKRWYWESYPEASSQLRTSRQALVEEADGIPEALEVIDAEYRVVEGAAGHGQPQAQGSAPGQQVHMASEAQVRHITSLAKERGIGLEELCQMAGREQIGDLTMSGASAFIDLLKAEPKR